MIDDETAASFADLVANRPHGGYGAILADPPWRFANFSAKGELKNPNQHYPCITIDDLQTIPVDRLTAKRCAIFMWGTWPMLPQALALMTAWTFNYKGGGAWAKQSKTGEKWAFGPGYIFRAASELLLVGTRGQPPVLSHSTRNLIVTDVAPELLIVAPVREHSRKPDGTHEMVEALYEGPYLELFGRQQHKGWTVWGNETQRFEGTGT